MTTSDVSIYYKLSLSINVSVIRSAKLNLGISRIVSLEVVLVSIPALDFQATTKRVSLLA